ncbi:MAG TPA: hypothetical protein VD761_09345 [Solirubrobacterales bacterium]|nr:hypothetical protein [Solirubrobacterales bacterium]
MKQLRKRLTYANVMSSIAVFLVLGGGAAFAANQLGKNTVGSKQLKKNAVTAAKIKNNAVTASKIQDGAISGAKINLGSLGTVPSATNAQHAATAANAEDAKHATNATNAENASNASNAANAENANTVAGRTVKKFFFGVSSPTNEQAILTLGGMTLNASCIGSTLAAVVTTSVPNTAVRSAGVALGGAEAFYKENDDLDPGESLDIFPAVGGDSVQGTITYATPGGEVVNATFASEEEDIGTFDCALVGTAIG